MPARSAARPGAVTVSRANGCSRRRTGAARPSLICADGGLVMILVRLLYRFFLPGTQGSPIAKITFARKRRDLPVAEHEAVDRLLRPGSAGRCVVRKPAREPQLHMIFRLTP